LARKVYLTGQRPNLTQTETNRAFLWTIEYALMSQNIEAIESTGGDLAIKFE